ADLHSGTQANFHELAAFFGSAEIKLVGVSEGSKPYKVKYLYAENETTVAPKVPFDQELFDGHGTRRSQLARWVTHPKNKPFARATVNRVWALIFGKPLVDPIDDIPLAGPYPAGLQLLADDEFTDRGSTIPQRLLMMNGNLVKERTQPNPLVSGSTRIATLTGRPEKRVEASYLAILTRRPTAEETQHFVQRLKDREDRN